MFLDSSEAPNPWQLPRVPPRTVLTGVAVETLGAPAAACEPVTGAIVLARAVQGASSPILAWEALCWQDMDRKTDKQSSKQSLPSPTVPSNCIAKRWYPGNNLQTKEYLLWRHGIYAQLWCFCILWWEIFYVISSVLTVCLFQFLSSQTRCWTHIMCCKALWWMA